MFDFEINASPGDFTVQTTHNRGHTPEELATNAVQKIISISDTAEPALKQQAEAFRERIYHVILHTLTQAVKSDRTTLYNKFKQAGHDEVAEILREM